MRSRKQERVIERYDAIHHTKRLTHREVNVLSRGRNAFALDFDAQPGNETQIIVGQVNIVIETGDRIAGISRL